MADIYIEYLPDTGNPQFDLAAKRIIDLLRTYLSEHDNSLSVLETVQSWTDISSFSNSWVSLGGSYTPSYFKDAHGFVHFKGIIKSGTLGSTAFTLPSGYRPTQSVYHATGAYSGSAYVFAYCTIDTSGNFIPQGSYNNEFLLDGISFYTG
jgi:hypothetical protein